MRGVEEVMMRCKLILDQPDIVALVGESSSPTSAYDMAMSATGSEKTAKAARWLGVLRRDYPGHYAELTHEHSSPHPENTAREGRGNEKNLCS